MKNRCLLLLGFLTGILSSYLGIGGGVVVVPALTIFFKYPIKKAIGTSLAILPLTALSAILMHFIIRQTDMRFVIAVIIAAGSILGARSGVFLSGVIKSKYLKVIFAGFLLYTGMQQLGLPGIPVSSRVVSCEWMFFVLLGLAAGLSSALLGIGGGVVMVPALNMLFGFSMHEAIFVSLLVIVPTSLTGVFFHSKKNNVDFPALKYMVPGAMIGALTGAILSNLSSAEVLHTVMGVLLIVLSVKMLFSYYRSLKDNAPETIYS